MKRNETILVYAVTGLLIVILGIAVLFGENAAAKGKGRGDGEGLMDQPETVAGIGKADSVLPVPGQSSEQQDGSPSQSDTKPESGPSAGSGDAAPGSGSAAAGGSGQPASRPVAVPLVASASAAERVAQWFGVSKREGEYRRIKVKRGDHLNGLVERWCGSRAMVADVEMLNEDQTAGPLKAGDELLVPWVDDDELVRAYEKRQEAKAPAIGTPASATPTSGIPAGSTTAKAAQQGTPYRVQSGDSLWRIAVNRVGPRKADKYILQIAALNPQLKDLDVLLEGQLIRLP